MSILRCKKTFFCQHDGVQRRVRAGELVHSDDPLAKGRDHLFESVEAHLASKTARHALVERATAEPGEKRSVGRPRKAPKADELTPENAPKTAAEAEAAGVKLDEIATD